LKLQNDRFLNPGGPHRADPGGPRYFAKLVDLCVNTPNALLVSDMALECPGSMVSSNNGMDQRWDEETWCENM
jgi:hypothetical protein